MSQAQATFDTSDFIATCAALVALVTFIVSAYQAYLARKHSRLSVKPIVSVETCTSDSNIHLTLHNLGLGPAVIKQLNITYKDTTYDVFVEKQLDSLISRIPRESKSKTPVIATTLQRDAPIPSNSKESILVVEHHGEAPRELVEMLHELKVFVRYESIYEDNFHADNHIS